MSFFDAFTGKAQQREISAANNTANAALDKGYGESQGFYNQAYDQFSPYAQQGQQANQMYGNLLGLYGQDAQNQSMQTFQNNPILQGAIGQRSNAMLRNLNARGFGGGGTAALAGQRVAQEQGMNFLNQYERAGQQGFQADTARAGVRTAQGDNAYGYGATKAGNAINFGNAMSSAKGIGVNNLMGLGGMAINAYTAGMGGYRKPQNNPYSGGYGGPGGN